MTGAVALLEKLGLASGAPITVTFQITDRCHYGCVHCYETHGDDTELSFAEIERILDQLAAEGTLYLTITGGEPFMRRDAEEILTAARRRGFAVKLLTTGWHIDDRRADFLRELGALQVDLSFYAADPAVHDAVTQMPGSWQRTLAAARRLRERGVMVTLKSPVMAANAAQIPEIAAIAKQLGTGARFDAKVTAREDGDGSPLAQRAGDDALRRYYSEESLGGIARLAEAFGPGALADGLDDAPCRAGHDVCGINPQGLVSACHSIPEYAGDLRQQSFREIWRRSPQLARIRGLTWRQLDECNRCDVRSYCNRCHAMALVEDGKLDGPSREACRHAVLLRDLLIDQGALPGDTPRPLPPPLSGQARNRQIRSAALKILA
jgi:radical SAM protein with 4Fe4S-binding SPASM domain